MKYIKKPIPVEAVKANSDGFAESPAWISKAVLDGIVQIIHYPGANYGFNGFKVITLEGPMTGNVGDYLIRGVEGELYPCRGDIFEKTYEKVEERL